MTRRPPSTTGAVAPSASVSSTVQVLESTILPALILAKAGATGIGIPGVESIINGLLELATTVSTMKSNKDDLEKLQKSLDKLISVDISGAGGDLRVRLTTLSSSVFHINNHATLLN
ncbi:hypothetical protein B0H13DRAFT_1886916 [Mycena leptocephala]|nr:hypothetical protein B0H13DRAFT_1886916 [Mycena leptocephala]